MLKAFCLNELEKRFDYGKILRYKICISCEDDCFGVGRGYSRKRLSLILIEVSKPFVIQGLLRRLDSRRVIRTRGTCSLNKDVAESMKKN